MNTPLILFLVALSSSPALPAQGAALTKDALTVEGAAAVTAWAISQPGTWRIETHPGVASPFLKGRFRSGPYTVNGDFAGLYSARGRRTILYTVQPDFLASFGPGDRERVVQILISTLMIPSAPLTAAQRQNAFSLLVGMEGPYLLRRPLPAALRSELEAFFQPERLLNLSSGGACPARLR